MRGAGISEFGGAVGLIDLPDPRPLGDDEVLIEIRAAGVGNWEEFVRTGKWDVGRTPPMALGVEAAGTIAAVGDSVEGWEPGDEVLTHPLPLRDQGAWAPFLIAPATALARKPASLSWEAAAAFPVPALTATQVIDGALAVRPDDLVLVNGGSGVTGALLVGLAADRGAEVIATAAPAGHERLRRLGAAHVLDYHDPDWPAKARARGGGSGVTAAANAVPGGAAVAVGTVRDGGRLATITLDPPDEQRGIAISSVIVQPDGRALAELAELIAAGRLEVSIAAAFPLEEAAEALAAATGGGAGGAVVLHP
ncbi:MAG TPA: NADP-dependent oxidoreductase [Gaiellales bacterium]|nr:NADP-dependent oxidoreductase [Gaiellales bacterium]